MLRQRAGGGRRGGPPLRQRASVGTSCRRSWPSGRAGCEKITGGQGGAGGRGPGGRRSRRSAEGPANHGAYRGARGQGAAQLHRRRTRCIMPAPGGRDFQQAYNCQAVVDQRASGDRGGPGHRPEPSDKRQAVSMMEETILPTSAHGAQGGIRRRRILLGARPSPSSGRPGGGPVRRAGEDPPRQVGPATGAPRPHTQGICRPGTGCAASCGPSVGRQRYALRMQTVEPVFGQIKQGRGFRQFLLRGLAKVDRRVAR